MKAVSAAEAESRQIIAEDKEEAAIETQLEQADEQIKCLERYYFYIYFFHKCMVITKWCNIIEKQEILIKHIKMFTFDQHQSNFFSLIAIAKVYLLNCALGGLGL